MTIVVAETKRALYFGCWDRTGHYLHAKGGRTVYLGFARDREELAGFPWTEGQMDGGLLKNGKRDVYDGKVYWTCGGTPLWIALLWWDNSIDGRGASNSGFYVQGFDYTQAAAALDYAGTVFPKVIARQHQPLVLQT